MRNGIHNITVDDIERIKRDAIVTDAHLVEIHGKDIQSWDDYLNKIQVGFLFPNGRRVNIDGYNDWMQDLAWLGAESYVLVIHEYSEFLTHDAGCKEMIMEIFRDLILPWWQADVEKYCAGGKAKPFNVYLVG